MPVRLDRVPDLAPRPAGPRAWLWLGLLPLSFLLLGVGLTLLFGTQALREQPAHFWGWALGVPLLGWFGLGFGRVLQHVGQHAAADGWDEAREEDLCRKMARGRRSQQVLSVSLYTALREAGAQPAAQLDALLDGTKALKGQPTWLGGEPLLNSRLASELASPEDALLEVLTQVLIDLGNTLARLPDDAPLALLLEVDSGLPENQLRQVWQQAWADAGIRQSTVSVVGCGLDAVDQWLDQRIDDPALLMVVAVQFAPQKPEGTAEAAVGVLFGNRLTQSTLEPLAYLHRPERERETSDKALLYAARQALDWVPLDATVIKQVWRSGVDRQRDAALSTVLKDLSLPVELNGGFCNLDGALGDSGQASPWLAIAAATQSLQRGAGPQFIFSGGGSVEAGLWSTVLTAVPPPSK